MIPNKISLPQVPTEALEALQDTLLAVLEATAESRQKEYLTVKECAKAYNLPLGWLKDQLDKRDWNSRPDLDGLRRAVYKPHRQRILLRQDLFDQWFQGFKEG